MQIAVASGKGGTGKTTVATSLAMAVARSDFNFTPPVFLDCDVEAPNAHIFLHPQLEETRTIGIQLPWIDEDQCTLCHKCSEVCQYHAIVVLGKKVLVFPELCHGCGSCTLMCPEHAISEELKKTGVLQRGPGIGNISFARGVMDVGEPMAVPIIRQLKQWMIAADEQVVILDAPPGSSCPVVETMRGADFILMVTEPTPFGLHDLGLAVEVARQLDIPAGVVINRDGAAYSYVDEFCEKENLPILMRIPFERVIAEGVARGQLLTSIHDDYVYRFQDMFQQIRRLLGGMK
jgi:MinD superfamily P-loop ATPase